jgi:uncharacterized protein (TIGR02453 family)
MADRRHFTPALFSFLKDLEANNDRDWFKANKQRYERDAKEPALRFIVDFGGPLQKISPHFNADPRPVGGSLFRIHRDTRFSRDKSPYKTHVGLHFRHEKGKDAHTPGFYLHLERGQIFCGVGLWHGDNPTLTRIRDHIVARPDAWKRAVGGRRFTTVHTLAGDRLKRPPRGYDRDHPLVEDLMWKDYTSYASFTQKQVTGAGFLDAFAAACRAGAPLVRFLCEALDQPF